MAAYNGTRTSEQHLLFLIGELFDLSLPQHRPDRNRKRAALMRLDTLLRRGRPFREIERSPVVPNSGDSPIPSDSRLVAAATTLLGEFGTLCINLHQLDPDANVTRVWTRLTPYAPAIVDWIELLHPMNGHVQVAVDTQDHGMICLAIASALKGVCMPDLHDGSSQARDYILSTSLPLYAVDLWVNLFQYVKTAAEGTATFVVELLYMLSYEGILLSEREMDMPDLIKDLVLQRSARNGRTLCRSFARYTALLTNVTDDDSLRDIRCLYRLIHGLADDVGMLSDVCPRDAIRTLVANLHALASSGQQLTAVMGLAYLECIWKGACDRRPLEWSLDDGIFDVLLCCITDVDINFAGMAFGPMLQAIQEAFVSWRVLHAFHRVNTSRLGELRQLARENPYIADLMTAYDARMPAHQLARYEWRTLKSRCSSPQCQIPVERSELRACSISPRDRHYLEVLVREYVRVNKHRIMKDALALDRQRRNEITVCIDFRSSAIVHEVGKAEQVHGVDEHGVWPSVILALWLDKGRERQMSYKRKNMAAPMRSVAEAEQIQREFDEILQEVASLKDEGTNAAPLSAPFPRRRTARIKRVVARLSAMARRERPFAPFDQGAPRRSPRRQEIRFSPQAPSIVAARDSLRGWGILCTDLVSIHPPSSPSPVWDWLLSLTGAALEWIDLLHPMNQNMHVEKHTKDYQDICDDVFAVLEGILRSRWHDLQADRLWDFLQDTNVFIYLFDLWVNIFRYVENVDENFCYLHYLVAPLVRRMLGPGPITFYIESVVRQRTKNNPRRICRVLAKYAEIAFADDLSDNDKNGHALFEIARVLLDRMPAACPRDVVRTVVRTMDRYLTNEWWSALDHACRFMRDIWFCSHTLRTLEWSINDGIVDVLVRTVATPHLPKRTREAADFDLYFLAESFHFIRVLRAFHRVNHARILPHIREVMETPIGRGLLNDLVLAYESLREYAECARDSWHEEVKGRCANEECPTRLAGESTPSDLKNRACSRCRSVYYCCISCQKAHWRNGHRADCIDKYYTPERERGISPRDNFFIAKDHHRSALKEIIAVDPNEEKDIHVICSLGMGEVYWKSFYSDNRAGSSRVVTFTARLLFGQLKMEISHPWMVMDMDDLIYKDKSDEEDEGLP
ncbi:hypothetical protein HDZ31DRAFT_74507 [Schizophyllum fasciatum]